MCQARACVSYASVVPLVCKHPDVTTSPQLSALHRHIAKRKTLALSAQEKPFSTTPQISFLKSSYYVCGNVEVILFALILYRCKVIEYAKRCL